MSSPRFADLDKLQGPEGLVIPVTYRMRDGLPELTFAFQKHFDRNGEIERTTWLKRHHLPGVMAMIEKLPSFLDQLEDRVRAERRAGRL